MTEISNAEKAKQAKTIRCSVSRANVLRHTYTVSLSEREKHLVRLLAKSNYLLLEDSNKGKTKFEIYSIGKPKRAFFLKISLDFLAGFRDYIIGISSHLLEKNGIERSNNPHGTYTGFM